MSDEFEIVGDEALEARIVAVVLGEASDFEREEVDRLCEERPELKVFRRRMETVHGLLGESRVQNPESRKDWQLSKERRKAVLDRIAEEETVVASPMAQRPKLRLRFLFAAAAVAMMALLAPFLGPMAVEPLGRAIADGDFTRANDQDVASLRVEEMNQPASPSIRENRRSNEESYVVGRGPQTSESSSTDFGAVADNSAELDTATASGMETIRGNPRRMEMESGIETGITETASAASVSQEVLTVGGNVENPGRKNYSNGLTLGEAISDAGGPGTFGGNRVTVTREGKEYALNHSNDQHWQERLYPGDTVEVEQLRAWESQEDGAGSSVSQTRSAVASNNASPVPEREPELGYAFEGGVSNITPDSEKPALAKKTFQVPPTFLDDLTGSYSDLGEVDAFAAGPAEETQEEVSPGIMEALSGSGIEFPEGSEARFDARTGELTVTNTRENLDMVDQVANSLSVSQTQEGVLAQVGLNDTRSRLLMEVDKDWELTVPSEEGELAELQQELAQVEAKLEAMPNRSAPESMERSLKMMAQQNSFDMKKERDSYGHYLDQLEDLEREQLFRYAAELPVDNNEVAKLYQDYESTKRQVVLSKENGLGAEHSKTLASEVQLKQLEGKLQKSVESLEASLSTNHEMIGRRLETMENLSEEKGADLLKLAGEMQNYREATREYENELVRFQELKVKQSAERVQLRSPKEPMTIRSGPTKPKKTGFLGLGGYESQAVVENAANIPSDQVAKEIQSRKSLAEVEKALGLGKRWGVSQDEAIERIQDGLEVEQRKGTDLYEIRVKNKEANLTRDLAAEVAVTFTSLSSQRAAEQAKAKLDALNAKLEDQEDKVMAKRKVVDTIVQVTGNPYFGSWNNLENNPKAQKLLERREQLREKAAQLKLERERANRNPIDEQDAAEKGDSTFSLNVSDVSFKLAQAALAKGEWPETVRVEEFVNAFDYEERQLAESERVGVAMEQAAHPFLSQRDLLRLSLQTAASGRASGVPLRLTVVLDKSGSMERRDRANAIEEAFRVLTEQLNPGDQVSLIGFSRTPKLLADSFHGSQGEKLLQILRETPSEGGTNVEEALKLAREKARQNYLEGAQNRIILLTDGIANLGNAAPEELMTLVEDAREEGIAFDACGVGVEGLNDDILEALTRKGNGRYYVLGSKEESGADFARQVAGALRPAASNVKVQVEWNVDRVGQWRLYGFKKHELEKEDFRDDSVDAAEMAAEEEGVALYHVQVKPEGTGPLGMARVRFQDVATGEMVERAWEIPYEGEALPFVDSDSRMRLAGVAGLTAEKLARTAVGERVEWEMLLRESRKLKTEFGQEKRVADLEAMIEQARILE